MNSIQSSSTPYSSLNPLSQTRSSNGLAALTSSNTTSKSAQNPLTAIGQTATPSKGSMDEMRAYHEKVLAAVKDGSYDAAKLAASAPAAVKQFAADNDVEVTDLVEDLATMALPQTPQTASADRNGALMAQYKANVAEKENGVSQWLSSLFSIDISA